MTPETFVCAIQSALDDYLAGATGGKAFVRRIDALMADELPDGLSDTLLTMLNDFQNDLALYVEDQSQRNEHPAYFGSDVLTRKATALREGLKGVRA